jgi:hypothetical protein
MQACFSFSAGEMDKEIKSFLSLSPITNETFPIRISPVPHGQVSLKIPSGLYLPPEGEDETVRLLTDQSI